VDVPELMKVLDFSPGDVPVLRGDPVADRHVVYPTPAPEFRLSRLELRGEQREVTHRGPQVLLTIQGEIVATDGKGAEIIVPRGHSVWFAATDGPVWITGNGTVFRATDGLPG